MIKTWLLPEVTAREIADIITFQQVGAPPHFAMNVRTRLNERFPNRWIGRGSRDHRAQLPWSPGSPDLTTLDNELWGIIKEEVRKQRYINDDQLKDGVRIAFQNIALLRCDG